jgi:hypothetical protein
MSTHQQYQAPQKDCGISFNDWLVERELKSIEREKIVKNGNGRSLCECSECRLRGIRYPLHRVPSDCEYVRLRSALIPQAAQIASNGNGDSTDSNFTRLFAQQMDLLASQLGI